jgi:hypothetical protein
LKDEEEKDERERADGESKFAFKEFFNREEEEDKRRREEEKAFTDAKQEAVKSGEEGSRKVQTFGLV